MKINVVLAGPLSKYGNGSRNQVLLFNDSCQLKELVDALGIPDDMYSFVIVNGVKASDNVVLQNGAEVKIYPMVSGG